MSRLGFVGITTPWRTIYILPSYMGQQWLINHELAHIAQINRDGALAFWPKITWDYFAKGYQRSPYEIEARLYESHGPDEGNPRRTTPPKEGTA